MKETFAGAFTFQEYLSEVRMNRALWLELYERFRLLPEEIDAVARTVREPVRLLALSEDWCGDAVNALPIVARLAEASDLLDFRVLSRDANPEIMDAHLTGATSRSIPIVIALDGDFRETGWWGPRPRILQSWVREEGMALDKEARYREIRRWYARDRGRTTVREIMDLVRGEGSRHGQEESIGTPA